MDIHTQEELQAKAKIKKAYDSPCDGWFCSKCIAHDLCVKQSNKQITIKEFMQGMADCLKELEGGKNGRNVKSI